MFLSDFTRYEIKRPYTRIDVNYFVAFVFETVSKYRETSQPAKSDQPCQMFLFITCKILEGMDPQDVKKFIFQPIFDHNFFLR